MSAHLAAELIEAIFAAALDEGASWNDVGVRLCALLGAHDATFGLPGRPDNVLMSYGVDEDYRRHYRAIDPLLPMARARARDGVEAGSVAGVLMSHELIPDSRFLRSEFFNDYSMPRGRRHLLGALVGVDDLQPVVVYRDAAAGPFDEDDRHTLRRLVPSLRRALLLRQRLALDEHRLGAAALDLLPVAVMVLDAAMRVRYLNQAAHALVTRETSGLSIVAAGAPGGAGGQVLNQWRRDDHKRLAHLVAMVCAGGQGVAMPLRSRLDPVGAQATLAAFVSPVGGPLGGLERSLPAAGRGPGNAMLIVRDTAGVAAPGARLLVDLFGLTRSEAEVAALLAGGATAEDVARGRGVSLDTVRSQVRAILRKTHAASLRDFERIVALVSGLQPPAGG